MIKDTADARIEFLKKKRGKEKKQNCKLRLTIHEWYLLSADNVFLLVLGCNPTITIHT